jgi:hypothetical protein
MTENNNANDDKKETTVNENDWKKKFDDILNTGVEELKRTAAIGKNMFNASNSNSKMNENFEEIGRTVYKLVRDGELKIEDERVNELCDLVQKCSKELSDYEKELNDIKTR